MTFTELVIHAEKKSYLNPSVVNIGSMVTTNINVISNKTDLTWKLIKDNIVIISGIELEVEINNFSIPLNITALNLDPGVYILEITTQLNDNKTTTTIFIGNDPFIEVDEYFVFGNLTSVLTYGDIRFDSEQRKLKFSNDWKADRTLGSGIARYNLKYYILRPKNLFTSRTDLPEYINFSPFDGSLIKPMKIHPFPKEVKINSHDYLIYPPTKIKIIYYDKDWKEVDNFTTRNKTNRIKLDENFNNFIFFCIYELIL